MRQCSSSGWAIIFSLKTSRKRRPAAPAAKPIPRRSAYTASGLPLRPGGLISSRPFHALRCRRTRGVRVTFGHEKAPSKCLGRLCGGGPKRITAAGVEPDVKFRVRRGGCDEGGAAPPHKRPRLAALVPAFSCPSLPPHTRCARHLRA